MAEILMDSFFDAIKAVPIIFVIFLSVDFFMMRTNKENRLLEALSRFDIIGGSVFGIIPQCGISVAFARMYTCGQITMGMLLAVFISSSDEALIIIGAHPDKLSLMLRVIIIKVIAALVCGYVISRTIREKRNRIKACPIDCSCPKCRKHRNVVMSNLVHTAKIALYLLVTIFLINLGIDRLGFESLAELLGKNTPMQPIYASLIGMIPSCASSVLLAEGFIKGTIGFSALISGLCANTGFGVLIILKELPLRRALKIILLLQAISILIGELIYLI